MLNVKTLTYLSLRSKYFLIASLSWKFSYVVKYNLTGWNFFLASHWFEILNEECFPVALRYLFLKNLNYFMFASFLYFLGGNLKCFTTWSFFFLLSIGIWSQPS